jgi:hypothetical protein
MLVNDWHSNTFRVELFFRKLITRVQQFFGDTDCKPQYKRTERSKALTSFLPLAVPVEMKCKKPEVQRQKLLRIYRNFPQILFLPF